MGGELENLENKKPSYAVDYGYDLGIDDEQMKNYIYYIAKKTVKDINELLENKIYTEDELTNEIHEEIILSNIANKYTQFLYVKFKIKDKNFYDKGNKIGKIKDKAIETIALGYIDKEEIRTFKDEGKKGNIKTTIGIAKDDYEKEIIEADYIKMIDYIMVNLVKITYVKDDKVLNIIIPKESLLYIVEEGKDKED